MQVIAQHSVSQAINSKHRGQELEPFPDLEPTMLVVFPAVFIQTTKKSLSNTPLNSVNDLNFVWIEILTTSLPSHQSTPKNQGQLGTIVAIRKTALIGLWVSLFPPEWEFH